MKQKNIIIIISIFVFIALIAFFYPKPYVIGGFGGKTTGIGATAYKEEYSCLGIKHSYYPKGCVDCASVYNCYGITYGKKCYIQSIVSSSTGDSTQEEPTICR